MFGSRDRLHEIFLILLLSILAHFVSASGAASDILPFNGSEVAPNIAVIEVTDTGVQVDLEIFIEDVPVFIDIIPAKWAGDKEVPQLQDDDRIARFGREVLSVRDETSRTLPISVELIEPRLRIDRASLLAGQTDPLTGRVVPSPPEDPRVVFARLFYDFEGEQPETLTFSPPRRDNSPLATIGMQVSDREVPVTEFRFLSEPVTLSLDWDDPWKSQFNSATLNRTTQDGTMTFLYVEPREVRQEVLIRLRDLAPYIDYNFELGVDIDVDEQTAIVDAATEFFLERSEIDMDGNAVSASSSRASILHLNAKGFQFAESFEPVVANAAFVGVILSYPIAELPEVIEVDWSFFDANIPRVPVVMTDDAGPFFSAVTPDSPTYKWVNHLLTYENPSISAVAVKTPVSKTTQTAVFGIGCLLAISAAFASVRKSLWKTSLGVASVAVLATGFTLRSGILDDALTGAPETTEAYDILGQIVVNLNVTVLEITEKARANTLKDFTTSRSQGAVAAELERGLAIRVPGGNLARPSATQDLHVEEVSALENTPGFRVLANWTAIASASHLGHDHSRAVRYRALAEIVPVGGFWRIDGLTVLEARMQNAEEL